MEKPQNPKEPIKVLLADDHTLFRQGLAGLLTAHGGLEIVGEVANDEGAIELAQEHRPDVVIMQVQMPFERSKESLQKMREILPAPKMVIVTMFEDPRYLRELMSLGVSAYLVKSASIEHLIGAVRAAVFDPKGENVVVGMPREMLEEAQDGSGDMLSTREMEVLLLAARGLSNQQMADSLRLAESTVKRHLANIYSKIGVGSRGEAVRTALTEEWITIQEVTQEDEKGELPE